MPVWVSRSPPRSPPGGDMSRLRREFDHFHRHNPHVYVALRELAFDLLAAGVYHYSIKALWEVLRYRVALKTRGDPDYKLNNNHHAFYARELMLRERRLREPRPFFELRNRRSFSELRRRAP